MTALPDRSIGGFTFDTGALIAVERGDAFMRSLLEWAQQLALPVAVPAGVVAQVWQGGSRQPRVARLLKRAGTEIVALDDEAARAVGALCTRARHPDVVDGSVALCAKERDHTVVTSDPDDIRALEPRLVIIAV